MPPHRTRQPSSWEEWAQVDPHYAVLSDPLKKGGGWDDDREGFYRSGDEQVAELLEQMQRLDRPRSFDNALDFGCGLGRVTQALAPHFGNVLGVDIAPTMVTNARNTHSHLSNTDFLCIRGPEDLRRQHFDLIWSVLVLQHLGSPESIRRTLRSLAASLTTSGLLVVEIPDSVPARGWRSRLELHTIAHRVLRKLGFTSAWLWNRLRLSPAMSMTAVPEQQVTIDLERSGLQLLFVMSHRGDDGVDYRRYFATRE